jgi:hypothetical protein
MAKNVHEIRDPIHVFIRLDSDERKILNSQPFQRLRYIHQLAMSYLVYPGATHRRFEHSLGVMELADRAYQVLVQSANDAAREQLPDLNGDDKTRYWRRVLRMAALCHDLGHLPFSHAGEAELLPPGWDHERISRAIILSDAMRPLWEDMTPPIRPMDVVKLALGPRKAPEPFSMWETILSEIIVGDAFGVDRMDYLLRDSHHAGVAYGKFDHYRLIDNLRILPPAPAGDRSQGTELSLGVEEGGIHSAEALMLARYFMFSQLYLHPIRRIYDIHLKDFLGAWLPGACFPTDVAAFLRLTDNEVTAAYLEAARRPDKPGHDPARRIVERDHFRVLYSSNPDDVRIHPQPGRAIFDAAVQSFPPERIRYDRVVGKRGAPEFPVAMRDGRVVSSTARSQVLPTVPRFLVEYVFVDRAIHADVLAWLDAHRTDIIKPLEEEPRG